MLSKTDSALSLPSRLTHGPLGPSLALGVGRFLEPGSGIRKESPPPYVVLCLSVSPFIVISSLLLPPPTSYCCHPLTLHPGQVVSLPDSTYIENPLPRSFRLQCCGRDGEQGTANSLPTRRLACVQILMVGELFSWNINQFWEHSWPSQVWWFGRDIPFASPDPYLEKAYDAIQRRNGIGYIFLLKKLNMALNTKKTWRYFEPARLVSKPNRLFLRQFQKLQWETK